MSYISEEELRDQKIKKLTAWLDWIDAALEEEARIVLSRTSELATNTGPDPSPRHKPCEHRPQWRHGNLCLACQNTGIRLATQRERDEEEAEDPYMLNPPREGYGVTRDQSDSARRARDSAALDNAIESLQRNAMIRSGDEYGEDRDLASVRRVQNLWRTGGETLTKILHALAQLRRLRPQVYQSILARKHDGLLELCAHVSGEIRHPPGEQA